MVRRIKMGLHAVNMGCNVVAYQKNNQKYGMTCAWAMMVDHNVLLMLLGGLSETGNNLEIGDIVGVSSLAKKQDDIALIFGDNHSTSFNKFHDVDISIIDSAILIPDSKVQMVCKVVKIEPSIADENDHLVYFEILKHASDKKKKFLSLDDVLTE